MRFSLYALGSIMFFSMRVHAAAFRIAVVIQAKKCPDLPG